MCRVYHDDATDGVWAAVVSGPDDARALWIPAGADTPPMMYLGPDENPLPGARPSSLVLSESRILTLPRESLMPADSD
jgi:hypothetical protein